MLSVFERYNIDTDADLRARNRVRPTHTAFDDPTNRFIPQARPRKSRPKKN